MLVTCPHCGDKTEQDVLLPEFTCGECDRPFRTDDEAYERWLTDIDIGFEQR